MDFCLCQGKGKGKTQVSKKIFIEGAIGVIQHTDGRYLSLESIVFKTVGNDTFTDSEAGTKVVLKTLGVNDTITDAERW